MGDDNNLASFCRAGLGLTGVLLPHAKDEGSDSLQDSCGIVLRKSIAAAVSRKVYSCKDGVLSQSL